MNASRSYDPENYGIQFEWTCKKYLDLEQDCKDKYDSNVKKLL